MAAKRETGGRG